MNRILKKTLFLSLVLSFFIVSGCSKKPVQYMKYGGKQLNDVSYHLDKNNEAGYSPLMAEDLTLIENEKIIGLKNDPKFNAEAIFVSNETKKETILAENCFKRLYPASLTKLMTAYVALKYSENLEQEVIVPAEARKMSTPYAKVMGLMENDHISLDTLLNCVLVHSSNDAAKALAIAVGGSEEDFVKLMNEEAVNLGAVDTNFTNSHGLHNEMNYTTLYDLYLMFHELLKDKRFVQMISQEKYVAKYKNGLGGNVVKTLNSTNQYFTKLQPSPKNHKIIGGKTGTTDEAGSCMLLCAENSVGEKYVIGLLKAPDALNLYAGFSSIFDNIP